MFFDPLTAGITSLIMSTASELGLKSSSDRKAEQLKNERVLSRNRMTNNDIRKRLGKGISEYSVLKELDFIESFIDMSKDSIIYSNGGWALDEDVKEMVQGLRKRAVEQLKNKAASDLQRAKEIEAGAKDFYDANYYKECAKQYMKQATETQRKINGNIF